MHWKIVNSNLCDLCNAEKQTIAHLLYECSESQKLCRRLCEKTTITMEKLDFRKILFNLVEDKPGDINNLIILITKFYIFRCKCQGEKTVYNQPFYMKLKCITEWKCTIQHQILR